MRCRTLGASHDMEKPYPALGPDDPAGPQDARGSASRYFAQYQVCGRVGAGVG